MGTLHVKGIIPAPPSRVWQFLMTPSNLHLWGPLIRPVTGLDRPLEVGDQFVQSRRDFFRTHSQTVLVEEVIPGRLVRMRDLSRFATRIDASGTIRVEAVEGGTATMVEEQISYTLGHSRLAQWFDRWLVYFFFQLAARRKTGKAFRKMRAFFMNSEIETTR